MKTLRALTAAVCVGALTGAVYYVRGTSHVSNAMSLEQSYYQGAQAAFASMRFEDFREAASPEVLAGLLAPTDRRGVPLNDAEFDGLRAATAEWLYMRFVQPSPERYRAWRDAGPYKRRSMEEMRRRGDIEWSYPHIAGKPLTDRTTFEQAFDDLWDKSPAVGNGYNRPSAICQDAGGLTLVARRALAGDDTRLPVAGLLPATYWHGMAAANSRWWWVPTTPGTALAKRDGSVLRVEYGVVFRFAEGTRRPLILSWVLDPQARRWVLEWVTSTNFLSDSAPVSPVEM